MNEETEVRRGPGRPPRTEMRPDARPGDSLSRAAQRAAEIRQHNAGREPGVDEFYIDPATIPDGWSYEWKREKVANAEDPSYQVHLAQVGWEPVSTARHPEMMPKGTTEEIIRRKGMILMERPSELTDDAVRNDKKAARDQVRGKEEQLAGAPKGHFERSNKGTPMASVKHSYERIPIPKE